VSKEHSRPDKQSRRIEGHSHTEGITPAKTTAHRPTKKQSQPPTVCVIVIGGRCLEISTQKSLVYKKC